MTLLCSLTVSQKSFSEPEIAKNELEAVNELDIIKLTEEEQLEYDKTVKKMTSNLAFHEITKILNRNTSTIMIPTKHSPVQVQSKDQVNQYKQISDLKALKDRKVTQTLALEEVLNRPNGKNKRHLERHLNSRNILIYREWKE